MGKPINWPHFVESWMSVYHRGGTINDVARLEHTTPANARNRYYVLRNVYERELPLLNSAAVGQVSDQMAQVDEIAKKHGITEWPEKKGDWDG